MTTVNKETIILLPGWTRSVRTYQKLIDAAPSNKQVTVVSYTDLAPSGDPGEFLENFPKYLAQSPCNFSLVGCSLGGGLALEYASLFPERINHLYLVNPVGAPTPESLSQSIIGQLANLLDRGWIKIPKTFANYDGSIRHLPMHIRLGRWARKYDFTAKNSPITIPTTIFWGATDRIRSSKQAERLQAAIPQSKLIMFNDEGHDWIAFSPEKFWSNIHS